jgi:hypothetical protein
MQIYLLDAKGTRHRTISAGVECAVRATGIVSDGIRTGVTPGVERLRTGACGVVVVVVSGGVTGSEIGRGIC